MQTKQYYPSSWKFVSSWCGLALAATLMLTGCAQLPGKPESQSTLDRANQPEPASFQREFQISGKLSVIYEQNGKPRNLPVNFNWLQGQHDFTLQLSNSFGQTEAEIVQNSQGVSLRQPGKPRLEAATLEQLLQENLGWSLPSSSLAYWLQGFVQQPSGLQKLSPADQTLQTEGWQLRFASWQGSRPKRLDMQRYTEQTGELRISIVIVDWNQTE